VSRGRGRRPVFNDLSVTGVSQGVVTMNYTGYAPPDDRFQLIVKVLPVFTTRVERPLVVNFLEFGPAAEGFRVRVTFATGEPVSDDLLSRLELMVEVSRYFPMG
jgi:hypothetical protein